MLRQPRRRFQPYALPLAFAIVGAAIAACSGADRAGAASPAADPPPGPDDGADGGEIDALDPSGPCLTFADGSFDTRAPLGKACTDHDQCGRTKVCSIDTTSCALAECPTGTCAGGLTCKHVYGAPATYCARTCGFF